MNIEIEWNDDDCTITTFNKCLIYDNVDTKADLIEVVKEFIECEVE